MPNLKLDIPNPKTAGNIIKFNNFPIESTITNVLNIFNVNKFLTEIKLGYLDMDLVSTNTVNSNNKLIDMLRINWYQWRIDGLPAPCGIKKFNLENAIIAS